MTEQEVRVKLATAMGKAIAALDLSEVAPEKTKDVPGEPIYRILGEVPHDSNGGLPIAAPIIPAHVPHTFRWVERNGERNILQYWDVEDGWLDVPFVEEP